MTTMNDTEAAQEGKGANQPAACLTCEEPIVLLHYGEALYVHESGDECSHCGGGIWLDVSGTWRHHGCNDHVACDGVNGVAEPDHPPMPRGPVLAAGRWLPDECPNRPDGEHAGRAGSGCSYCGGVVVADVLTPDSAAERTAAFRLFVLMAGNVDGPDYDDDDDEPSFWFAEGYSVGRYDTDPPDLDCLDAEQVAEFEAGEAKGATARADAPGWFKALDEAASAQLAQGEQSAAAACIAFTPVAGDPLICSGCLWAVGAHAPSTDLAELATTVLDGVAQLRRVSADDPDWDRADVAADLADAAASLGLAVLERRHPHPDADWLTWAVAIAEREARADHPDDHVLAALALSRSLFDAAVEQMAVRIYPEGYLCEQPRCNPHRHRRHGVGRAVLPAAPSGAAVRPCPWVGHRPGPADRRRGCATPPALPGRGGGAPSSGDGSGALLAPGVSRTPRPSEPQGSQPPGPLQSAGRAAARRRSGFATSNERRQDRSMRRSATLA